MECRECMKKIPEFLDGSLPEQEQKLLQNHMKNCLRCHSQFNSFDELDGLIQAADVDIPSVDLTADIMKLAKQEISKTKPAKHDNRRRMVSLAQDLVAAAAAAMIIFWFSAPILAESNVRIPSEEVVKVSTSVGGAFQAYIDLSASAFGRFSDSFKQIDPDILKGDE